MGRNRNKSSIIQSAVIEAVEARQMFAVTAAHVGLRIIITGTSSADNVIVSKVGTNIHIRLDATHNADFPIAGIVRVQADLGGGADTFTSDNSFTMKMDINGGDGNDTLTGGGETDVIRAGSGNDRVNGNNGKDQIEAGIGNDIVNGNGGDDYIFDEAGTDNYFGGDGNDTFFAGDPTETDLYDGQGGNADLVTYEGRLGRVLVTTDGVANDGYATGGSSVEHDNVFNTIEEIIGGKGNDDITYSGPLNCTLIGNDGSDRLVGANGNDLINGDLGNDTIFGGMGDDQLNGADGLDQLNGNQGNDTISGGNGNDSLSGESGNDILTGGTGVDTMKGGAGDDRFFAKDNLYTDVLSDTSGNDRAQVDSFLLLSGVRVVTDTVSGIETFTY